MQNIILSQKFRFQMEKIKIYAQSDFEGMRKAGKLAAKILDYITPYIKVGVSTAYLDDLCHKEILRNNAIPAPLNYHGFPKATCISVNHVVCHGIPNEQKILKDGDILNIDITVILDGWYGDTGRMFYIGKPSIKAKRLVETTYECMMLGIEQVKPGNTIGDIGYAIQQHAESRGFSVVRDFCGHGLGRKFHDSPNVPHFGEKGNGQILQKGMFFTIEPMINAGKPDVIISKLDKWTATTRDKSLSAQFEHSLGVTDKGCEIFTLSPKGYKLPPYE
jgi:methionyl aminopeptidase